MAQSRTLRELPVLGKSARVLDEGMITEPITLSEASAHLKVDVKTLRRKLQDLSINPATDPKDKRNRLLTAEQFETVKQDLSQSRRHSSEFGIKSLFPDDELRSLLAEGFVEALTAQLQAQAEVVLRERQRQLEQWEARLTEREKQLHEMTMMILRRADRFSANYEAELALLKKREAEREVDEKHELAQKD